MQWQLHKYATYMNFSSIQSSSHGIIILQLILRLKNVITLFIFIWIMDFIYLFIYIIVNFIKCNLYHVDTCHYIGEALTINSCC
jgi:hypothetical protein